MPIENQYDVYPEKLVDMVSNQTGDVTVIVYHALIIDDLTTRRCARLNDQRFHIIPCCAKQIQEMQKNIRTLEQPCSVQAQMKEKAENHSRSPHLSR